MAKGVSLGQYWGVGSVLASVSQNLGALVQEVTSEVFLKAAFRHPFCSYYIGGRRLSPREAHSASSIDRMLNAGATVVMQQAQDYIPELSRVKNWVDARVGIPCRITGFFTPVGNQGLPWHRDEPHVCAIQLEGFKSWEIEDKSPTTEWEAGPLPVDFHPRGQAKAYEMRPGDLMYGSPGVAHRTASGGELESFHVSIIFPNDRMGNSA
ncbi:JmjC domain-containing protein [Mangrovactinospora gilvigrisea]|uniref:JmjC domain-containing protein n=1 Tax=Mangrovactinospora gilvigrisea TaxID=1428644 RepID=UPI0009A1308D|nr:cupin domain-containing protein [Mangrovactinospora gilvigrisea]